MKNKNNKNIGIIIFIFIYMILGSISENVRGVFIPKIKGDFAVSNSSIGIMVLLGTLGYVISTFFGGILCDKIGQKKVIILGNIFLFLSMIIFFITPNFQLMEVGMFILNVGLALISIAVNTVIPTILVSFQAILMNLTHFSYGLGASIGPGMAGVMLNKNFNWRQIYLYMGIVFLIVLIIFSFVKTPIVYKKNENKINEKEKTLKGTNKKLILFYIIALGFYVAAERCTADWLVNYGLENFKLNEAKSAMYSSMFFITLTIGRLLGGFVVEKRGYVNTVLKSLSIAFILYMGGILIGEKGLLMISISGLFFSIIFPTLVLTISKIFKENTSFITGFIITFSSLINMFMGYIIGKLNDVIGIYKAFYTIPISLFISLLFTFLIYLNTRNKLNKAGEMQG